MMKPSLLAATLLLAGAGVAQAADLAPLFGQADEPEPAPAYTLGSGWYLRGDVGYGDISATVIDATLPPPKQKRGWDGDIGAGYRWTNWFRTDLTLGLHDGRHIDAQGGTVICPYQLSGLTTQGDNPINVGYAWSAQTGTCTGRQSVYLDQAEVLANGYVDLGTWYGLTPYIGAGVGAARVATSGSSAYYRTSDGGLYGADLTPNGNFPLVWINPQTGATLSPQPTVPGTTRAVAFAPQNWKTSFHRTRYNFAWALMGGVSYAIDNHLMIDLGYRYLNDGALQSLPDANGRTVSRDIVTQEVRLGLRYEID
jgi:opacity protein-like surface antigen